MYDKVYLTLQQLGAIKSKLFSKTSYLIGSGWPRAPGEAGELMMLPMMMLIMLGTGHN